MEMSNFMKKLLYLLSCCLMIGNIFSLCIFSDNSFADGQYDGSDWAKKEITQAIEKGIVPDELQCDYKNNITRAEFCKLCVAVMKAWDSDFKYINGKVSFSDTNDKDVLKCASMGIVNGIGDNKFAPNNPIKRQEAARMLYNTLSAGTSVIEDKHTSDSAVECCIPHSFDDGGLIRNWARDEINHMYRFGVMLGVSGGNYNPDGYYTREQAICTFLRLFNCKDNISRNPIPESDYYPYGETAENYISEETFYAIDYNKENYTAEYVDSKGNMYTQADKGYIYPFDRDFQNVITSRGVGVGSSIIIDKNGDTADIPGSVFSKTLALSFDGSIFTSSMYSLPDLKKIFYGNGQIFSIGDDLFAFYDPELSLSIVDSKGKIVIDKSKGYKYNSVSLKSYNGIFVLKNPKSGYDILNSKGETVKHFNVSPSWELKASSGSNACFYDTKGDKGFFYKCYAEKAKEYDGVYFTDNNEAIVRGPNYHKYILNSDGTLKFDAGSLGYKNVEKIDGFDFYKLLKDNGESGICDIVDKNGKIIKKNVNRGGSPNMPMVIDKSGVFAYITEGSLINFFDFNGDDLGKVRLSNTYGTNINVDIKFINGMLFTKVLDSDHKSIDNFYVSPYGKILR